MNEVICWERLRQNWGGPAIVWGPPSATSWGSPKPCNNDEIIYYIHFCEGNLINLRCPLLQCLGSTQASSEKSWISILLDAPWIWYINPRILNIYLDNFGPKFQEIYPIPYLKDFESKRSMGSAYLLVMEILKHEETPTLITVSQQFFKLENRYHFYSSENPPTHSCFCWMTISLLIILRHSTVHQKRSPDLFYLPHLHTTI